MWTKSSDPWGRASRAPAILSSVVIIAACLLQAAPAESQEGEPGEPFTVQIFASQPQVNDGEPITFMAQTNPPGFEDQVLWSAVTRCGTAEPATGQGEFFTTVFMETYCLPPDECRWLVVRANEAEFKRHTEPDCIDDIVVPPGPDCWETDDCTTKASFCIDPLPQDFFGNGSKAWRGEILLQGPEDDDTIIDRKGSMSFPGWDVQNVKIEITHLRLEGCHTIVVDYDDGSQTEWDVLVEESDFQEEGDMKVTRQHDNGGFFESSFPVYAKFTFTDVADSTNVIVLDTGDPASGRDAIFLRTQGSVPWVSEIESGLGVTSCGQSFTPGISPEGAEDPGAASTDAGALLKQRTAGNGVGAFGTPNGKGQCCVTVGHDGPGHLHVTKKICKPCPPGACYNKLTLQCRLLKLEECTGQDEIFQGMGTNCRDQDADKLPDFTERDDCCKADVIQQDSCLSLSSPRTADTDGDGMNDGDEILQGRDPCTPDP